MSAFKTRTLVAAAVSPRALTMTACGSSSSDSAGSSSGSAGGSARRQQRDYTIGVSWPTRNRCSTSPRLTA
jgi:hypothetical protein